jgi:outer membrane beta-barrel protein
MKLRLRQFAAACSLVFLFTLPAFSEDDPASPPPSSKGQKLDVESVKKKYWATGNESEMNVVQNRMYSKAGRFVVEAFAGTQTGDPFLVSRNLGGLLSYHFNEYVGVNLVGWKTFNSNSSAVDAFLKASAPTPKDPNSNRPSAFVGGELSGSLIYGKLSVLGTAIVYFDLHAMAGLGQIMTQNGNYIAPTIGVGQQVFLSKTVALRADYRVLYFKEDILDRQNNNAFLDARDNWTNTFNLGVSIFFP